MTRKKAWRLRLKQLIGLFGPKTVVRLRYFHGFKRFPNLTHPVTFNEKINAYKFMGARYNFARYADKVAVKDYIAAKIGAEYVIPTLYAGETLPSRAERTWALPYVIKMNHGSGWNILVRTEAERNWDEIEKKIAKWSKLTFGRDTGEVHYSQIKPQVLVEEFLTTPTGKSPIDYKFHMIHGQAEFTELDIDRETNPTYAYYDKDWNQLPFSIDEFTDKYSPLATAPVPKPQNYETMLRLAEILSADFPLVRVDFYNLDGRIYFGELTFTPFAGFCYFKPSSFDAYYGAKLHLDSNEARYETQTNNNDSVKGLIGLTSPKTAITLRYLHMFKTWPDLEHPVTFSEKINAYKLQLCEKYARLADKVAVKDFVTEKIGIEHVIPTLYAGETLPSRAERTWALPYVIKMNHGSGWNILVRTEAERNWDEIEKKIAKWSKLTFGRDTGEVHYSKIKPMVLVEEFISTEPGVLPKDYKIFVFNGKTEFIEIVSDREHNHAACFYNTDWQKLNFSLSDSKPYAGDIEKPATMDTMVALAETLAADFPFVRVDFYDVNGHIYLGEMTFTPSAGFAKFTPSAYDVHFGQKLVLA